MLIICFFALYTNGQVNKFISVKDRQFYTGNKALYYIGTNYWYGELLGLQKDKQKGTDRLRAELDFLKSMGVTNLRIMAGPEGEGLVSGVQRVQPPLQTAKGTFNKDFLDGLDLLLSEMGKRNMNAVIFLSNNWEWSGGFLQYLRWNDRIPDTVFRRILQWDEMRDYISSFYSCEPCKADYLEKVGYIMGHINSITKTKYTDDPAIMSWEIANEPRPMRPAAIDAYINWIASVADFIKSRDKNHLLTVGTEGYIGTESMKFYETIHADKNIDYLTIHIWPKNWDWFHKDDIAAGMDSVLHKTKNYILEHIAIADKLHKPLVIEEFGLPRDNHSFDRKSTTIYRDMYYSFIFTALLKSKNKNASLGGVNFWSYGGNIQPAHIRWQEGDEYIGDPPMEEQGLNAVFNGDKTTWSVIEVFHKKIKN